MAVLIRFQKRTPWLKKRKVKKSLRKVLKDLGYNDNELSILFTNDHHISQLNLQYLGRKGATNVLAFPMKDEHGIIPIILGDVVISVETAFRESKELKENPEVTVNRLLIHGLLHLLGYEHESSELEAERMEREEKRLLSILVEE
jgi:rRNA maturation RNase YbeY